jgi:hypothetical protein
MGSAGPIAKGSGQGIIRHDPHPHLVAHQEELKAGLVADFPDSLQFLPQGLLVPIFPRGHETIGDPEGEAIHQDDLKLGSDSPQETSDLQGFLEELPVWPSPPLMALDALRHLRIAGLGSGHKSPAPRDLLG